MAMARALAQTLIPCIAALALAGCGGQDDGSETYKTDVEDRSGGELIVATPDPNAVPVRLPETPMTPVPVDTATAASTATASATAAAD
jgi:hypothetical protein